MIALVVLVFLSAIASTAAAIAAICACFFSLNTFRIYEDLKALLVPLFPTDVPDTEEESIDDAHRR